jgi:putative Holliday junction resolvase
MAYTTRTEEISKIAYLLFEFKIGDLQASKYCRFIGVGTAVRHHISTRTFKGRPDPTPNSQKIWPAVYYSLWNRGLYHQNMRVMALDVGDKTIGVAVSDALLLTAQARSTIRRKDLQQDIEALRRLVEEDEVHQIVVGQPLHMDGKESRQSHKVRLFADELGKRLNIPIVFWDERLTSFAAEQHLEEMGLNWRKRREHVDKIAAMIILQNYLDSRSGQTA